MLPGPNLITVIAFVSSAGPFREQNVLAATPSLPREAVDAQVVRASSSAAQLNDSDEGSEAKTSFAGDDASATATNSFSAKLFPFADALASWSARLSFHSSRKQGSGMFSADSVGGGSSPEPVDQTSPGGGIASEVIGGAVTLADSLAVAAGNTSSGAGFSGAIASSSAWGAVSAGSPYAGQSPRGMALSGDANTFGEVALSYDLDPPKQQENPDFSPAATEFIENAQEDASASSTNAYPSGFSTNPSLFGNPTTPTSAPEPSTAALFLAAFGVGCLFQIRRSKSATPNGAHWKSCYHPLRQAPSDQEKWSK